MPICFADVRMFLPAATRNSNPGSSASARAWWFSSAEEHDRLVAVTSHLPQLISTALASVIGAEPEREGRRAGGAGFDPARAQPVRDLARYFRDQRGSD